MDKMKSKPFVYVEPLPSKKDADESAYIDYVKNGDAFFKVGLTKDQFLEQRDRMINWSQASARSTPNFYNKIKTKFDGYRD